MKRIKLILISAIVTLFTFSSCEDAYDIVQPGELNEQDIRTLSDLQLYLNSVYGTVSISDQIGFTGIFTDETSVGRGNGGQNLVTHRFLLNANDPFADAIWSDNYVTINRVNRTLRIVENQIEVPTDPTELSKFNSIIAQARALRAFSYFQLLTYFSPDIADDSALGVMFLGDDVPLADSFYPRSTNGVIFEQIESDLNFAYDNLYYDPVAYPAATRYKFVTQNMIDAMRARMYLYRENYVLAKQYAQAAITNSGLSLTLATPVPANAPTNASAVPAASSTWNNAFYGTASPSPYRKMFADAANSQGEIIFALDRPAVGAWENVAANFTTNTTSASGSPLFEVSRSLFNILRTKNGDVRRYANVDPTSIINVNYDQPGVDYIATDVLVIDKYPGKPSFPLRNDLKVFRLSEMFFILAECLAQEGNINGATNSVASIIQQIRTARNFLGAQPLPVYANATEALTDILLERRIELAFEAHRYIDIKRLGPVTGQSIDRHFTDDQIQGVDLTIPNTDYRFTLPIPQDEFNANPLMEQNPGYNN